MPTRPGLWRALAAAGAGAVALPAYAIGIEPGLRLTVAPYRLTPPGWTPGLRLPIAVVADLHAAEPHMPLARVERIVTATNALRPGLIALLCDYTGDHRWITRDVPIEATARDLARLRAPLDVHAVLGNHDWWQDATAQAEGQGPPAMGRALAAAGIPVLENDAVRLEKGGRPFWLLGLGDQWAFWLGRWRHGGIDDLPGTRAQVADEALAILLAHEPDIFPSVPPRVALTLSGHTHGGQIRIFGWSPVVPSAHGSCCAYGHVVRTGGT